MRPYRRWRGGPTRKPPEPSSSPYSGSMPQSPTRGTGRRTPQWWLAGRRYGRQAPKGSGGSVAPDTQRGFHQTTRPRCPYEQ